MATISRSTNQKNLQVLLNTNPKTTLLEYSNDQFRSVSTIEKILKCIKNIFLIFTKQNAFDSCKSLVVAQGIYKFLKNAQSDPSFLTESQRNLILSHFEILKNKVKKAENKTQIALIYDACKRRDFTLSLDKPHPDFVGLLQLKQTQKDQLNQFKIWQRNKDWKSLHTAHFDWWMFPSDKTSVGQGGKYTLNKALVEVLKKDKDFMLSYREGVLILLEAWGWDTTSHRKLSNPSSNQTWNYHDVRLGKVLYSLKLFNETILFKEVQSFAKTLIQENKLTPEEWIRSLIYS